jgi:hypothetical protein
MMQIVFVRFSSVSAFTDRRLRKYLTDQTSRPVWVWQALIVGFQQHIVLTASQPSIVRKQSQAEVAFHASRSGVPRLSDS